LINTAALKKEHIISLLKRFSGFRVLVVGDVMVDAYLWGRVSRISPEAPVPVVSEGKRENRPGGAANVALNIHSLGAQAIICSVIGNDAYGDTFTNLITDSGMSAEGMIYSDERITTVKQRIIAGGQQLLRVDSEQDNFLEPSLEKIFIERTESLLEARKTDALIFQDYDKGVVTPGVIDRLIGKALQLGIPVLVDPKKRNFKLYRNATLFKPNFKELTEGLNIELCKSDILNLHKALEQFQQDAGFEMVLLTLSENGMLINKGNEYHVVPAETRDITDVSGAGDTVIAVASLALAAGMDAYNMARLANAAAGFVCEKAGVVPVDKDWLIKTNMSF